MMKKWVFTITVLILIGYTPAPIQAQERVGKANCRQDTKTEEAIRQTLRQWIKSWAETDVALCVKHFGCKNGWAWIETIPHYADDKKHEPHIDALLHLDDKGWKVVYVPDYNEKIKGEERPRKDPSLQRFLNPPYGNAPLEIFKRNEKGEEK